MPASVPAAPLPRPAFGTAGSQPVSWRRTRRRPNPAAGATDTTMTESSVTV